VARCDVDVDVLVVDDHPGVRAAIEALIAGAPGLRLVGSASSGAAAIEIVARLRPAVVIMDLGMPGIDGVRATREICKSKVAPVVVAFSARASCGAKRGPLVQHTPFSKTRTRLRS
jgi:DNA-binding NarL/FixJ family response regulator